MGVLVHKDFEFIVQGITGREALNFTRECLEYGSKIVGGVTPGRGGREVYGVPVYDIVKKASKYFWNSFSPFCFSTSFHQERIAISALAIFLIESDSCVSEIFFNSSDFI